MHNALRQHESSWFRGPLGRRYGIELALIVVAKLALLTILYFLFIAPQSRADTSPASVRQHLSGSAVSTAQGDAHDRP